MSLAKHKLKLASASLLTCLLYTSLSCAAPNDRGRPQGPPPEAIDACANLSEGDSCSFTGRRDDTVEGTCMRPPEGGDELACAPEGGAPEERARPR